MQLADKIRMGMRRYRKRRVCPSGRFVLFRRKLRDRETYDPSECHHTILPFNLTSVVSLWFIPLITWGPRRR
jgi:hypothetical protein